MLPKVLTFNGENITDKKYIANKLNDHFVNIAGFINKVNFNVEYCSSIKEYVNSRTRNDHFDLQPISAYEVSKIIKQLNPNKSVGLDGIGPKLIKFCSDYITVPLSSVINRSISQATFPDTLKNVFVIPIYMSGPKSDPNNYGPISILPNIQNN